MTALTITTDKTTVTLSDGQTAWTLDAENALRLVAQVQLAVSKMESEEPPRARSVPSVWARGLVAP